MASQFFVKLIPSRPTFNLDMTPDEAALMQQHVVYWNGMMKQGKVHVFGPVMDPEGVYGMGVLEVDSEEEAREFAENDPAKLLMSVRVYPMRAVLPS